MVKIVWSYLAIDDLNNIANYCSNYSNDYASSIIQLIFNRTEILKTMPELGRKVPEQDDVSTRELIEGNYRIIYQFNNNTSVIEIITVHLSSRPL